MFLAMASRRIRVVMVYATVFHAPLLHELQYKLPALLNVRDNVQKMSMAADEEQIKITHEAQMQFST